MNRYVELISKLQTFCEGMNCYLIIKYYSSYEVCFKAVDDEDSPNNPFSISVGYPSRTVRVSETGFRYIQYSPRRAVFDICSCYDDYAGGQFTRKDIELLLSIDDLTDEELGILTPEEFE